MTRAKYQQGFQQIVENWVQIKANHGVFRKKVVENPLGKWKSLCKTIKNL
jgi:hypothetical protein